MKKMSRQDKLIPTREQAYFQISENLYGENEVIKVTFNNNGAYLILMKKY